MSFEVAVQNLFIVDVIESEGHLNQPGHDLMLREQTANLLLSCNFVEHVTPLAVVHDDAEAPEWGEKYIFSMKD